MYEKLGAAETDPKKIGDGSARQRCRGKGDEKNKDVSCGEVKMGTGTPTGSARWGIGTKEWKGKELPLFPEVPCAAMGALRGICA